MKQVNEEYAWNNHVWVIGEEEQCSEENMVSAPDDDGNPYGRVQSNSTTISMPPSPGTSGPTFSTIPSRNLDDDLGRAIIQFTDDISTVYNISYAHIKRRN